ncbi:sir2 family histone deacetylase hst4 [Diplodia corticola]|uniref:Sir2 family histone deacetylase hst4 n=1 Tax=Diplodia corticola TaxID=236234 RepID=A0A1J9SCU0_9PEZI|nr:sir2 family histone deacetylase hst4 [Diplodia corticola]OJD37668.1 sir2 family histone deacetylase hst4 [Diplodia corticola]
MAVDAYCAGCSRESSPLSSPPSSPCPPSDYEYPSPPPSQDPSTKGSPLPDAMEPARACDDDGPPRKKRRTAEPKPRVTRHLNLQEDAIDETEREALDLLLKVLHKKRKIVMIVGAGISVAAGIPDFRSSKGLFNTLKQQHNLKSSGKDLFDASVYRDPDTTATFHEMVRSLSHQAKLARPTAFHQLIATLADEGRLLRLYSQNVDGIETSLQPLATQIPLPQKGPWPKTVLLHGGLEKMVCAKCNDVTDFEPELFHGPIPPPCKTCEEADQVRTLHAGKRSHGIGLLRPRMVLYNENGPDDEAIGSVTTADLRARPDAVIVVGTTLKVPGVRRITREMVNTVRDRKDGLTVWINNEPEPKGVDLENCWDLVVRGPCDAVARQAALRIWNDRSETMAKFLTEEEYRASKEKPSPEVRILSSPRKDRVLQVKGIPTPASSPKIQPQDPPIEDEITVASRPSTPPKKATTQSKGKGKNLSNVPLAERPKPKSTSVKTAPKKKAAPKKKSNASAKPNDKITNAFSVSKPAAQNVPELKSKPQRRGRKTDTANGPMAPVSPQSAKNNTAPPHNDPHTPKTLSLETKQIKAESNAEVATERGGSPKEVITPTGYLPKDMKRLLH